MKRVNSFFGVMLLAAVAVFSCQDHQFASDSEHVQLNDDQVELHIGLNVSGNIRAGLRSISDADESAIDSIYVLAFMKDDINDEFYFLYSVTGKLSDDKTQMVMLAQTDYEAEQQFVVITNAADQIVPLLKDGTIAVGTTKSALYTLLKFSLPEGQPWDVTAKFPMWGETKPAKITKDTNIDPEKPDISPVDLRRMVARIDVVLELESTSKPFIIDSVYLYNTNTEGYIVPDTIHPTVPVTAGNKGIDGYIGYEATDPKKIEKTIYTFETKAEDEPKDATCVVIAGYYDDDKTNNKKSYYRVDFFKDKKRIGILRNHKYVITVTRVNARGYETKEDAFKAKSLNLEANMEAWGDVPENAVVNDQYYLAVNVEGDSILRFSKERGLNKTVTIDTDYSEWKMISKPDWIDVVPDTWEKTPQTPTPTPIKVTTNSDYTGTTIRDGKIIFQAGLLKREITVKQADVDEITIDFYKGIESSPTLLKEGDILEVVAGTGAPFGVKWTGNGTATNSTITIWTTPYEGLTYAAYADLGTNFIGNRTSLSLFRTADHETSGVSFPIGLRLRAQVSNKLITVEKSIVIKFIQ